MNSSASLPPPSHSSSFHRIIFSFWNVLTPLLPRRIGYALIPVYKTPSSAISSSSLRAQLNFLSLKKCSLANSILPTIPFHSIRHFSIGKCYTSNRLLNGCFFSANDNPQKYMTGILKSLSNTYLAHRRCLVVTG